MLTKDELPECPVATTVQLIGSKWKLLIMRNLMMRPWRFNELKKSLEGISQKVLTDSLRSMEEDGLITRTVYPEVPPRVEYALSDLGETMRPILDAMQEWGTNYKNGTIEKGIPTMGIRLVCSDLDGTLLQYGKKELEGEIFDQIRALHDRGILFCPASGRQYTSLRKLFAPVADCCIFLCENGGVIYKDELCIAKNPMPRALAEEIAEDLWSRSDGQGEVMLSGQNTAYLMERGLGMLDRIKFIGNNYQVIQDPSEIPEDIVKVSVYLHEGVAAYADRFVPRWEQANCAVAGPYWIDTTLANKGIGVQSICKILDFDLADVMAFGDNYNDVSMLDIVGHPYIMDGAAGPLREKYPQHTPRPEDVLRSLL